MSIIPSVAPGDTSPASDRAAAKARVRARVEAQKALPASEQLMNMLHATRTAADGKALLDSFRAELTAEFVAWLAKKAREHRAQGPQYAKQADVIGRLADKVSRGAVRPNNLLMLPAQGGPEDVPALRAELDRLRTQVAELEAQRDRRRGRLVALQNDALNMRGSLSPNGEVRKVPFELGETLTPAVDWLIARVAELERGPRQTTPVEAFAYDMDTALVNLPLAERRGADAVLQVLRARAEAAVIPSTTEATS